MKSSKTKPKKSAQQHANQKMLKVAVIVVAIIVVLSVLFLLPKKQFAGKAVSFGELGTIGTAGVGTMVDNTIGAGETFTLPVKVNIGDKKSVAAHFKLTFAPGLVGLGGDMADCAKVAPSEDLVVIKKLVCTDSSIEYDVAVLCDETCSNAITGEEMLTEITLSAKDYVEIADKVAPLTFEEFTVLDLETNENLVKEVRNATLTITKEKEELPPACGNNELDAGEDCDAADNDLCDESCKLSLDYIYGDLNLDGNLDVSDWNCFALIKDDNPSPTCLKVALAYVDFNCNGKVGLFGDVADVNVMTALTQGEGMPVGVDVNGDAIPDCREPPVVKPITIQLLPQTGDVAKLFAELKTGNLSANNEYLVNVTITPTIALPADHLILVLANYNDSVQKTQNFGTYSALEIGKAESSIFNTLITASSGNVTFEVLVWSSLPSPDETFTPLMERGAVTYAIK